MAALATPPPPHANRAGRMQLRGVFQSVNSGNLFSLGCSVEALRDRQVATAKGRVVSHAHRCSERIAKPISHEARAARKPRPRAEGVPAPCIYVSESGMLGRARTTKIRRSGFHVASWVRKALAETQGNGSWCHVGGAGQVCGSWIWIDNLSPVARLEKRWLIDRLTRVTN